jgi:hypothetical protein
MEQNCWNIIFAVELLAIIILLGLSVIIYFVRIKDPKNIINENVENTSENKKSVEIKKWFYEQLSKYFLLGIIMILLGTIIFCLIPKIDITNNYVSAIFGFVGILATFVVVSNYAQVKDVKDEFDRQVKDIEGKFEEKIEKLEKNNDEKIKQSLNDSLFIMKLEFFYYFMKRSPYDPSEAINYLSDTAKHMKDVRNKVFIWEFINDSYSVINNYFNSIEDDCLDIFIEVLLENSTIDDRITKLIVDINKKLDERKNNNYLNDAT